MAHKKGVGRSNRTYVSIDADINALENAVKPKKAAAKKAAPKAAAAVASKAAKSDAKPDDLKKIEGIGPKIAEHLNNAGILSYADLAGASYDKLKGILSDAGSRYAAHDPGTWANQSKLAANGEWDALKKLQDELDGGKVVNKSEEE